MEEEKNGYEGIHHCYHVLKPCIYVCFYLKFLNFVTRYLRRKVGLRKMKRNKKRCGKGSVNMKNSGKEHEKIGYATSYKAGV